MGRKRKPGGGRKPSKPDYDPSIILQNQMNSVAALYNTNPRRLVVDPIQAYLGNDSDLLIAGKARKLMQRLGMWASVYDCAVVLIGHLNKKEGSKDLYRSLGSIDVVAAARSVLQVERNMTDSDIRIVHQIKNSLAPVGNDIEFEIRPETGFRWIKCETPLELHYSIC